VHDLSPVAGLTNLTCLEYTGTFCRGITALTTLTALTSLSMLPQRAPSAAQQYAKLTTQAALAAALPALARLKQLSLSYVQPGPLTDILSQLTSLTKLEIFRLSGISWATPLLLPVSLYVLELPWLDVAALCGIFTPSNLHHVTVKAQLRPGPMAGFEQLAEGLLQHCADLSLMSTGAEQGISEQEMMGLMTVLKSTWRPTGAARRSDNLMFRLRIRDKYGPAWALTMLDVPCTQRILQQVPLGITYLHLM
jgi:hypothetical protein